MWQPEPGWERLPGAGPSTTGIWSAEESGRRVVVKRLRAPEPYEHAAAVAPDDVNHWHRAVDVARSGLVASTPGVVGAPVVRVEEDDEGATLVHAWVDPVPATGVWLAHRLGVFAGADLGQHPWLARGQLGSRLALVESRGGWHSLARTPVADVADHLWRRRAYWLGRCADLPHVAQHGDPSAANLPGRAGADAVGIDWAHLGTGPAGSDLGYLSLSVREEFGPLVDAYVDGLPRGTAHPDEVRLGASVTAVYTALTRVDWALARVAGGEGALVAKFRHPAVAPYIRAMQRQLPQIELLLA